MTALRYWLCTCLLNTARRVHPSAELPPGTRVWQIVAVPRRITKAEADEIAAGIKDY